MRFDSLINMYRLCVRSNPSTKFCVIGRMVSTFSIVNVLHRYNDIHVKWFPFFESSSRVQISNATCLIGINKYFNKLVLCLSFDIIINISTFLSYLYRYLKFFLFLIFFFYQCLQKNFTRSKAWKFNTRSHI